MLLNEQKLNNALSTINEVTAVFIFSTEEFLVRKYAQKAIGLLVSDENNEFTQIDGPQPSIEQITIAAGTISFFSTKRVVYLSNIEISSMSEADIKALCELIEESENSVYIITSILKDEKASATKKFKQLIEAVDRTGFSAQLAKPLPQDIKEFVRNTAKALNTPLADGAAQAICERCGNDMFLIEAEMQKLAAKADYKTITMDIISEMGIQNITANVFDIINMILSKNAAKAFKEINRLIYLQNDPIAISAAICGGFIDIFKMKCAMAAGVSYSMAFKELGYKGSDYRFKKAGENAKRLSRAQLDNILDILLILDTKLKSTSVSNEVLLQQAVGEIILVISR